MLDRNLLSDRAAISIITDKHREAAAAGIVEAFRPDTVLTVHWDGKVMPDSTGRDNVDRLPTLVSTMGETKMLGIPKIPSGTCQAEAQAVYNAI